MVLGTITTTYYEYNTSGFDFDEISLGFVLAIFFGFLIVGLLSYLLTSFAYYNMAKKDGHESPWFAFIPIIRTQVHGELVRAKLPFKSEAGWKFLAVMVVLGFLAAIPIIGVLAGIVSFGISIWFAYQIFDRYSKNAVLFLIISILTLGLAYMFIIFILRNEEPRY